MDHHISILFYARKSKMNRDGLVPIYIRITVNGRRLEQSIQRQVDLAQWSAAAGRLKVNTSQAKQLNLYLDTLKSKVLQMEREMVMDRVSISFSSFQEKWLGLTEPARMLLDVFQHHNDQMAALIQSGKDYCPATLDRYNTCRDHVRSFIHWKYKVVDIDIKRLDYDFVTDLEFWLKTHRNCAHNTTLKYISNLKKS